jgi:hypothetical protein
MPHPTITHTCDVYRLTRTGTKDAYGATPVITGLDVSIIPASPEIVAIYGGQPSYALYEIYTHETVSFKTGDKLAADGKEWIVSQVPQQVDNRYISFTRVVGYQVA